MWYLSGGFRESEIGPERHLVYLWGSGGREERTEDTAGETDNIVRREVIEVGFSCGDQALFE